MIGNPKPENIDGTIGMLTNFLAVSGFLPQPYCAFCGQTGTNTYAEDIDQFIVLPTHAECNRVEAEKRMADGSANRDVGGVALGFFGSLVGNALAVVGLFLITALLGIFFSIEVALIPIAGAFFAKLFKGSMNISTIIFNSIFAVIGSIILLLFIDIQSSGGSFVVYYLVGIVIGIIGAVGMINKAGAGKQNSANNLLRDANAAIQAVGNQFNPAPAVATDGFAAPISASINTPADYVDNTVEDKQENPMEL